jgi:WhiB family transcriptional regulator, redox-sensing transcriptional regulator
MSQSPSAVQSPARLLPIVMPGPAAPFLGNWHARGLCSGADPDVFFPSHGDPGTKARQICGSCTVRRECLEYATAADEWGIWGGLDEQERRNLRKKRQRRRRAAASVRERGARTAESAV